MTHPHARWEDLAFQVEQKLSVFCLTLHPFEDHHLDMMAETAEQLVTVENFNGFVIGESLRISDNTNRIKSGKRLYSRGFNLSGLIDTEHQQNQGDSYKSSTDSVECSVSKVMSNLTT